MTGRIALAALVLAACGDRADPFPPGLEPLEDTTAPAQTAPYQETLATVDGSGDYVWVHGRGYIAAPPDVVWAAALDADLEAESCDTTSHTVTAQDDPTYELSFLVHYVVEDLATVEWDEQWRFGEPNDRRLGRYQKVYGSAFITLLEGSIEVKETDDPAWTELDLVEHVEAAGGSADQMKASEQFRFDSLVAVAHGGAAPSCP